MRILFLALSLAMTSAIAAPPKHTPKKTPPADAAQPAQDIDVDAMARAKDANATTPASDAAPADANAAAPSPEATHATDAPNTPSEPTPAAAAEPAPAAMANADAPALTRPAIDPQEQRNATGCAARATGLLDAAQKGDFAAATKDFDAKMRSALPVAKFKALWESMSQFGALQARGEAHPGKGEGYYFVMTPLIFEKTTLVAQIPCGSDGLIAGFNVKPLSQVQ